MLDSCVPYVAVDSSFPFRENTANRFNHDNVSPDHQDTMLKLDRVARYQRFRILAVNKGRISCHWMDTRINFKGYQMSFKPIFNHIMYHECLTYVKIYLDTKVSVF